MNVILGATGQVGSSIAEHLTEKNESVKAVIRNPDKADDLKSKGVQVEIADYFDLEALQATVKGGELIFVLTPENGQSEDLLGDTQLLLKNYQKAIQSSGINKIVGLSSIGAQHESGTGNLQMSYMLEHAFADMKLPQVFVRPAYYFSNWLPYLPVVKEQGVLPSFFPVDQKIPMISPQDVAGFIVEKIASGIKNSEVYELVGPKSLSAKDVAENFGEVIGRDVKAQQIPKEQWKPMLQQADFTDDAAENLIAMTEAVIDSRAKPEAKGTNPVKLKTSLKEYFKKHIV
jgi:uncharacterized protein YbjT (DUF2867 family)